MSRKKVLIITYHWPPKGGGGVQRWLKMSKYLRDFGWEPIIFTAEGGEVSLYDESLLDEIPKNVETIRVPIWEPFDLYKKLTGKKSEEKIQPGFLSEGKSNWRQDLAQWIRGNLFIPDAKRFWIKPAAKKLIAYLKKNPVDAIVSTGPPHTTHMIALKAKRKTDIPWLADFRDPWTFVDYYDKLMLTKWADRLHHKMERQVINTADKSITVTPSWAADFNKRNFKKQVSVITNGYDPADFKNAENVELDATFTITHIGSMNADRNPHNLWPQLRELVQNDPAFAGALQLKLIGPVDYQILQAIEQNGLKKYLIHHKNIPHAEVIAHLQSSPLLLLPLNDTPNIDGVVPGKLFEYLGAQRPILCIGKTDGDAAKIIGNCKAGKIFSFKESYQIGKYLKSSFKDFKKEQLYVQSDGFEKYSRGQLAGQFAEILELLSK